VYCARKLGKDEHNKKDWYPHDKLEPILRETFGIIVYQEQVMQIAQILSGYSLGEADLLRRAMGKKIKAEMDAQRERFVSGAKEGGLDKAKANEIFDLLNKFAAYGFNKSHSAAYALVSYQTAYLKANYPVQFMAAVLTAELGNAEKVAHFIAESEAMGITVLGPDVNESRETFTPVFGKVPSSEFRVQSSPPETQSSEPGTVIPAPSDSRASIRFGLAGIKGVGEQAAQKVIEERDRNGAYRDFDDFLSRLDGRSINKRVLEHLAKTGAFDFSGASRKKLFDGIDAAMAAVAAHARDKAAGQHSFFDMFADEKAGAAVPSRPGSALNSQLSTLNSAEEDFSSAEKLAYEKELLGFYVSGHPLNAFAGLTEAIDTFPLVELLEQPDRT
ncbi:MAG TPA: DNA polymerase III subunit alpha, partial [Opitutus sp.]|nr:DNA polymerase III subunit alpha [Opitutus sp.]